MISECAPLLSTLLWVRCELAILRSVFAVSPRCPTR